MVTEGNSHGSYTIDSRGRVAPYTIYGYTGENVWEELNIVVISEAGNPVIKL